MKKICPRRLVVVFLLGWLLLGLPGLAFPQGVYPSKPIRLVVGFSAGGATDILARVIGQKLAEGLGQPVVVDNRPGATGIIGTEYVAKSAPDGYTLLHVTAGTHAINASLYKKLPYDPVRDFTHVIMTGAAPNILVVHPSLPVKTVKELIDLAKVKPGQLTFGSAGTGSTLHLSGELFKAMAGVDIVHVPYKGGAPAMTDLLGGRLTMIFDSISQAAPHIKAGKIRALAVTTAKRVQAFPEIPTIAEAGVPGYEATAWFGIVGPANIPPDTVKKLNSEFDKILKMPEVKDKFAELGTETVGGTSEEFTGHIKKEIVKWAKVVEFCGAKID